MFFSVSANSRQGALHYWQPGSRNRLIYRLYLFYNVKIVVEIPGNRTNYYYNMECRLIVDLENYHFYLSLIAATEGKSKCRNIDFYDRHLPCDRVSRSRIRLKLRTSSSGNPSRPIYRHCQTWSRTRSKDNKETHDIIIFHTVQDMSWKITLFWQVTT